jgi:Holliday junction DNA helicase RuvA
MYEYIKGTLTEKNPGSAVIESGAFGYRVFISTRTFDALPPAGTAVKLHLHRAFNAEQGYDKFFGFSDVRERTLFLELLEVQRIGPSVAMRILSSAGMDTLVNAIANGDVLTLKRIKGVGPKMAERLVVELQGPLSKLGFGIAIGGAQAAGAPPLSNAARDALSALVTLGYRPADAEKAVIAACESLGKKGVAPDTSAIIRAALAAGV